ncbi:MAG: hypothetical protein WDN28_08775 [Chthoniobacter sp.]
MPTLRNLTPANNAQTQALVNNFHNLLHPGDAGTPAPAATTGAGDSAATAAPFEASTPANEVRSRLGEPQQIVSTLGGGQTWYYPTCVIYIVNNRVTHSQVVTNNVTSNSGRVLPHQLGSPFDLQARTGLSVPPHGRYAFVPSANSLGLNAPATSTTGTSFAPRANSFAASNPLAVRPGVTSVVSRVGGTQVVHSVSRAPQTVVAPPTASSKSHTN